ncbi:MAG TPA: lytic murein transglycosylase [Methylocystis sp.]|nr:lytic murein transglycosylase [Methylocystis sp.]
MQDICLLRSKARIDRRRLPLALAALLASARNGFGQPEDFASFVQSLWPQAQTAGVSRETFETATSGLSPEPAVLEKPSAQSEFTVSIPAYVAGAVTNARVAAGRTLRTDLSAHLRAAEQGSGVPAEIMLAILGIESNYGSAAGGADVLRVLATLAFKGHMAEKLSAEFVAALVMLQQGVPRRRLLGSWAGAMGMPQFMPSAYLKYAVSASGGGAPDIWTSRADSLASIANFLRQSGWDPSLPWAVEARAPNDYDFAELDQDFSQFRAQGLVGARGEQLPAQGAASVYLPAGAKGPLFLITQNFEVIRQYNTSDAYAMAVGLLADRIGGVQAPVVPWPKVAPLSTAEIKALQQALTQRGFYQGPIDGKLGRKARNAIHAFQRSVGIAPADGFASKALLAQLRDK